MRTRRIKTHRGMTISEAEQIIAYVEFHYEPETSRELIALFDEEARDRGFRKTSTAACARTLHEQWERA